MARTSVSDGTLRLDGELTLATAGKVFRDCASVWADGDEPLAIDLADTGRIDSAGLALLLEWQAQARQRGAVLQLRNPPDDLLQLAALCEASDLLGLDPATND